MAAIAVDPRTGKMMALHDKFHAIQFGIVAGVPAHEHDGETLLYAIDVPYEFRDHLLPSWVKAQERDWWPPDSPHSVMRCPPEIVGLAYTWRGWEAFVDWVATALDAAILRLHEKSGMSAFALAYQLNQIHLEDLRLGKAAAGRPLTEENRDRAFKGGLANGVPNTEKSGSQWVTYLHDIPLELCGPLLGWLAVTEPTDPDYSLPSEDFYLDGNGPVGIGKSWTNFQHWMHQELSAALERLQVSRYESGKDL
ncbi:hypothetical protein ACW9YQ_24620 (plasmid) [Paraburkholderia strydomiana]